MNHETRAGRGRAAKACLTTALGLALALGTALPASAVDITPAPKTDDHNTQNPDRLIGSDLKDAEGQVAVFVQLQGPSAFEATQPEDVRSGSQDPVQAAARVQAIRQSVESMGSTLASASGSDLLYTTSNALRGVALKGDAAQLRELSKRSDVVKISKIVPAYRNNAGSVLDTNTLNAWTQTGQTGKGVKVAIIDSGIDYTHADFGGPGTVDAYKKAKASNDLPGKDSGLYDSKKFLGGYDLAGDAYDAQIPTSVPKPDNNPLDCEAGGHGTHVAGTTAGYGVGADGKTYKGDFTKLTQEQIGKMRIGPGTAPEAQLIGLRVFGCEGSTNLVLDALDRSLDPNMDGDFSDKADIINMSLGSDFGPADDPQNDLIDALSRQGILSVIAAGNAGDAHEISGSPGSARSALTVANSQGSTAAQDKAEGLSPDSAKGELTGSYSGSFNYSDAKPEQLQGDVVVGPQDNRFGCTPFSQNFGGKWVMLDWEDKAGFPCGSKVRFDNVQAAGGKGVVLESDYSVDPTSIAGNAGVPGLLMSKESVAKIKPAAQAGGARVKLAPEWIGAARAQTGQKDQVNDSTSRGQHGSNGVIKPDVAAPGTNIGSAGVAAGNGVSVKTGTSMATPHVAGIAALVQQKHQNYNPQMIKAAIMNSAVHDVHAANGATSAVDRVGSGRVDALRAVNQDVLVYDKANPALISSTFGVTEIKNGKETFSRELVVDNTSGAAHTYQVRFDASTDVPGVSFSTPGSVSVAKGGKATVKVTTTVDRAQLAKTHDPSEAVTQLGFARQFLASESGRLVLTENGQDLRVPMSIAPKPAADMRVDNATLDRWDKNGTSAVALAGTGLDQGGWQSALGAFELGAKSGRLDSTKLAGGNSQFADLQYVGASSNLPQLKAEKKDVSKDGMINFGVSSWGNASTIKPDVSTEIAIDTTGNGRPNYIAALGRTDGLDYPVVNLYGYVNGELTVIDSQPLNGSWGDVDTNTFDTNAMVMPVSAAKLGIDPTKTDTKLTYQVTTFSGSIDGPVDRTGVIEYSPVTPKISFRGEQVNTSLFTDLPGKKLTAHRGSESAKGEALFLHLHNATGDLSGIRAGQDGAKAEVKTFQSAAKAPETQNPMFKDVPKNHVFYSEISWLANKGITRGWPDGTFRPAQAVNRDQMAAFLYRMAGSPQYTPPTKSPFKDVPTSHVFYKEIAWMSEQGITKGWPDGTFRPYQQINRDQMAAFFYRMAGSPAYTAPKASPFKDVPPNRVFYKEIAWMNGQNIARGWSDGTFRPYEPVRRDQMAAFLFRYDQQK
ncbi:S8 family serine peptidase [Kocuria indica]|uniref:S8 family serine peptidase n=1 Tax=Kocuria marina TaxID=223184 RepID=UPI001EF47AF0|nr:S8 family serine peptidase [Kocuria indica]MCG7430982.1 S8 family serine peptidase [Kocuria indica]